MENATRQAFCEVYDVINHMDKQMQEKIPNNFKDFIKNEKEINYAPKIDYSKDFKTQISKETKVILSLIYRDYLCSKQEKERLIALDSQELRKEKEALQEKSKVNFANRTNNYAKNIEEKREDENLPTKPEKWYIKIINFFKKILKK